MKGMFAQGRVRIAHRRDKPEAGIIYRLRLNGWAVFPLSGTPGLPDLLCVKRGMAALLEVKEEGGSVTPAQVRMHRALKLAGYPVPIVSTPEEALSVLEGGEPRTIEGMRVARNKGRKYPKRPPGFGQEDDNCHKDLGGTRRLKVTHPKLAKWKGTP